MNLHEFQTKEILKKYGIAVPEFYLISSLEELEELIETKKLQTAVLKVQIHAGGRGKAGGVKFAKNPEEMRMIARALLGKKFVTEQTGPDGLSVQSLLISHSVDITREFYLGIVISRKKGQPLLVASPLGGVKIEEVAESQPDKLIELILPPEGTFRSYHFIRLAHFMGWKGDQVQKGSLIVKALTHVFNDTDASLLEINPLVETPDGQLLALDAKLTIDDNALYRQPKLKALFDVSQASSDEVWAWQHGLSYVALNGDIGCMVNGAGLAMATMDLIHYFGGHPANFLDIGGGATKEMISEGFKILLSQPKVRIILVNIFGGMINCEILARGIIEVVKDSGTNLPIVIRLEGTNSAQGKTLIEDSGLNLISVSDLTEAVKQCLS